MDINKKVKRLTNIENNLVVRKGVSERVRGLRGTSYYI